MSPLRFFKSSETLKLILSNFLMLRVLDVFCYSCSHLKGRKFFQGIWPVLYYGKIALRFQSRSAGLCFQEKIENHNYEESFDHFLQINYMFCFHFSWSLCARFHFYKCPWNNGAAARSWGTAPSAWTNTGRVARFFFTSVVLQHPFLLPVFMQGRATAGLFLCSHLPAKPTAD